MEDQHTLTLLDPGARLLSRIAVLNNVVFRDFLSLCLGGIGFDTERTEILFRNGSRVTD